MRLLWLLFALSAAAVVAQDTAQAPPALIVSKVIAEDFATGERLAIANVGLGEDTIKINYSKAGTNQIALFALSTKATHSIRLDFDFRSLCFQQESGSRKVYINKDSADQSVLPFPVGRTPQTDFASIIPFDDGFCLGNRGYPANFAVVATILDKCAKNGRPAVMGFRYLDKETNTYKVLDDGKDICSTNTRSGIMNFEAMHVAGPTRVVKFVVVTIQTNVHAITKKIKGKHLTDAVAKFRLNLAEGEKVLKMVAVPYWSQKQTSKPGCKYVYNGVPFQQKCRK